MSVPYTDPNANKPGYYLNYDTGTWMPVQNIVPQSPYPGTVSHAGEPGYINVDGQWIPDQQIVPQSPYPPAPPVPTAPTYNGSPGAQVQTTQPVDTRPAHVQQQLPPVPSSLSPGMNSTIGGSTNLSSNPNAPANMYQPATYGTMRGVPNNPSTYAQQVNQGRMQPQPNQAGYGGGTNTTSYSRLPPTGADFGSRQYVNPNDYRGGLTTQPTYNPPVSIPTGEHPLNPTPLPATQLPAPHLPSYAVPGGRHQYDQSGMSTYTNPTTGLRSYGPGHGWTAAPAGSGVAYMRQQQPQGFGGFNMHDLFNRDRSRFGGY